MMACARVTLVSAAAAPAADRAAHTGDHRGGPPQFDLRNTCRAVADHAPATPQRCLESEQQARQQLSRQWAEFRAADRTTCVGMVTNVPGVRSYIELLTCLEMARDARTLPKEASE